MPRLIDADALVKAFWDGIEEGDILGYEDTEELIKNAPTIEAEPVRHGRWEWRGGIPWCSNCGEMPPGYSYEGDVNTTPYCPNCGAKMDGEQK